MGQKLTAVEEQADILHMYVYYVCEMSEKTREGIRFPGIGLRRSS